MERVSIIEGKKPILVVAPHGFDGDDENTSIIAEAIANVTDGYAVINRGWERDETVDFLNDKADCNNVNHCHEDVVREEFLDPILRFRSRILKKYDTVYMYMIHGMGNKHRILAGEPQLDVVIGYGAGSPNSHTCDLWRKNLFMALLTDAGMTTMQGKKGGAMSGWARSNMNQLFRKWYPDPSVQALQIEIVHELRKDRDTALLCAEYLALAMIDMLSRKNFKTDVEFKEY